MSINVDCDVGCGDDDDSEDVKIYELELSVDEGSGIWRTKLCFRQFSWP